MLHKWSTGEGPGTHRPPRHPSVLCYNDYEMDGAFRGRSDIWNWSDTCPAGAWIDTGTKHGFIVFAHVAAGNLQTRVTASPSPTKNSFTVADIGDLSAGDFIRVATDYVADSHYPFEMVAVTGTSGNTVSHTGTTGTPLVDGYVLAGAWYAGGGNCATRYRTPWYIYDPADLASVAQGRRDPDLVVPRWNADFPFPGSDRRGGSANAPRRCRPTGAAYDAVARRLYIYCQDAWNAGINDSRPLVYVFSLNG
jgi:hypothetical protein